MKRIGVSTGAVAKGDFRAALKLLHELGITAVELSALREDELPNLINSLSTLDLSKFEHISVHVPSAFQKMNPMDAIELLAPIVAKGWPVVLHPDAVPDLRPWARFSDLLLVENMDKRKPIGRTVGELDEIFKQLPDASLCFDIAHARQVDPTMSQAILILQRFGDRVRQVHISEVNSSSRHTRLTAAAFFAYPEILRMLPENAPVIIESVVARHDLPAEIELTRRLLDIGQESSSTAKIR